jgi:hypothetical protein
MPNYHLIAEPYKPTKIEYLLIGEAPPPSGVYFYKPMRLALGANIENDRSLPSTIFNHYFDKRPESDDEYLSFLFSLKKLGIFLVDIIDDPIKVADRSFHGWVNPENLEKVIAGIGTFMDRLSQRGITIPENRMIFLLARKHYVRTIREAFPGAYRISWKDFRMKYRACPCCAHL